MQVIIIQLLLFCISWYSLFIAPSYLDRPFMLYSCILAFISIMNAYRLKETIKSLKGQYFRHSALFLIAFIVVHYQYFFDYAIGIVDFPDVSTSIGKIVWYNEKVVPRCLAISNIGLNAFLVGYLYKKRHFIGSSICYYDYRPSNMSILTILNTILIFLYVFTIDKRYLFGGYAKHIEMGETASRIGGYIIPSICSQLAIQTYQLKKTANKLSFIEIIKRLKESFFFVLIMSLLILMSGRRTHAVFFMSMFFLTYLIVAKRTIKLKYFIPGIISLSVLMFVISRVRIDMVDNTGEAIEMLSENNTTISPLTQELAFNCSSLQIAITHIPDKIQYLYGLTWVNSFVSAIPGGNTLVGNYISIPLMFQKSDNLLTILVLGSLFWGIGTSILADIYVNLGISGIIFLMFMFGYVIRILEEAAFHEGTSPYLIGVSLVIYSSLIYITRGSIWFSIGPIAYVLLLIALFTKKIVK